MRTRVYVRVCACACAVRADVSPRCFSTACWLLHPSWHMCVYKRMFKSENKVLSKEGVLHFLELFEAKRLPFAPEVSEVTPPAPRGPLSWVGVGWGVKAPGASLVTLRTRQRPRRQRVAPCSFALGPPQFSGLRHRVWTEPVAVAVADRPRPSALEGGSVLSVSEQRGSGRENSIEASH